jgi:ParB-like chromosome segregation protein Spo0J
VVRNDGDGFELVAGFHRIAAARSLGLSVVPVVVRDAVTEDADRAVETIARKQLNPQTVSRDTFDARTTARVAHDRSHPARFERPRRCVDGEKHPAVSAVTTQLQMLDEGLADVARQRQAVALVALAVDLDLPGPLEQVVEPKPEYLDRAQTEPREQHEDREIARADPARSVAGPKQSLDLRPRRYLRDAGLAPAGNRRDRAPSSGSVSPRRLKKRSSERSRLA